VPHLKVPQLKETNLNAGYRGLIPFMWITSVGSISCRMEVGHICK
jgi:hypothetical protein